MYLKKIHIQGFKSFADKTEIKFKDDITAIVGPNGSGKSNISDAIRWVLGEQSVKNLRGSKMEDVIFSGTNKRRALSFSEVTIFFDNKDGSIPLEYSEVAVTRRMFRSGESEYYINKNACRLKDIRSIFMDTGIGKDGYSIIGQGKIDEILSNKPEDRRNIFEEAAGIIKYKTKKEESQRKLKNTSDNLIRISDLISEISGQYKKLESDSKKANEFISYFDELKSLETNIYIKDIKDIDIQKTTIQNHKEEIEKEIDENEDIKQGKQNIFNLLKKEMEEVENKIEDLRREKDETSKLKDKAKNDNSLLLEKENFNKRDLKRLDGELIDITNQNSILDKELLEMDTEQNQFLKEYKVLNLKYEEDKKNLNKIDNKIINLEKEIDNKKDEMNLIYEKIADRRGRLNNINSSNLNNTNEEEKLKIEKEELYEQIDTIEKNIKTLNQNKEKLESGSKKLIKDKSIYILEREQLEKEKDNNIKNIRGLEINIERTYSSYNLYKNMQHSYEGYYKSVKNLIQAIESKRLANKGFHGTIADLLTVDSIYETAINISLGGNLQNIVVNNEGTAQNMIKYLKDNKLGRVTFLPISTIKGKSLNLTINDLKKYGVMGLANELVRYDEKYENIFKSLLGRTMIIDNIENAINFAKKTNYIYRIVTLEGEILNPGGSLSGGSYKNNISIINRKKKIEEMKVLLDNLELELDSSKKDDISINRKLTLSEKDINTLEKELDKCNINIINVKNEQKSLEHEREFIHKNIIKTEDQIHLILKTKRDTLEESIRDRENLEKDLARFESIKEEVYDKTNYLKENKALKDKKYKEINNINISIQSIENKISNLKINSKNSMDKRKENYALSEQKTQDIILTNKNLDNIVKEKKINSRIIEENSNKELKFEKNIEEFVKSKDIYMNRFYKEQENLKILNENINILDKNKNKKELSLSKLKLEKDNIRVKLIEDYKLSLEDAFLLEKPVEDIKACRERVNLLKRKIKGLGNVNLSSIEEYKEVKDRLQFMETQHDDLIESKENLKMIIKDIESEMRVSFLSSFEEIKGNFSEIFSEIFDGGSATLELSNEEDGDILESGIEIKAKPPGKVLQSLSLLSGGEKSLVAVALLFAILKTKPSPFCILDEIDAALDDSNISRYTSYLKKINKDTQFVLITHRKLSMEIANVLYGVTMEEKGVSRIISMKLNEDNNELVS